MEKRRALPKHIQTLDSVLKMTRPSAIIAYVILVFVAFLSTGGLPSAGLLSSTLIAVLSAAAGGFLLSDYYDLYIDKVNRPDRPLPAGKITPAAVWVFSLFFYALSIWAASSLPLISFLFVSGNLFLLFLYATTLKKVGFLGNIAVAYLTASVFLLTTSVVGDIAAGAVPSALIFLYMGALEVLKDMEDVKGDFKFGARTLPLTEKDLGKYVAMAFMALTIALSPIPYYLGIFSVNYIILILIVDLSLVMLMHSLWRDSSLSSAIFYVRRIKASIVLSMAAFILGVL
ncbi:TPA: UbiA family prenyltransferase [archaeon]|nr:UbiA family prenyltransferase [Candidatus Undinarchaeales archaeon SRR5007147.bin71]